MTYETDPAQPVAPLPLPPPGYAWAKPGRGLNTTDLVLGAIGAVIGLGPALFGIFAAALGLAAIALGFLAWRAARKVHGHSGRVAMAIGALTLVLGIVGLVTVDQAVNDLEDDLEQIGE